MSTLKVDTIQDQTSSNSSTPAEIYSGRAKAWVNFDGTGTVAIRADFNVSSITDNGTGIYTVNFSSSLGNTNYAVAGASGEDQDNGGNRMFGIRLVAATSCGVLGFSYSGSAEDLARMCAAFFSS